MPKQMMNVLTVALVLAASVPMLAQASGKDTYTAKCQMCHGADGMAATPAGKSMKAIPFNDPQILNKSDTELIATTKKWQGQDAGLRGQTFR